MSATATSPATPELPPTPEMSVDRGRSSSTLAASVEPVNPHHRGGRVLFEVRFTSPMSDLDLPPFRPFPRARVRRIPVAPAGPDMGQTRASGRSRVASPRRPGGAPA